MDNVLKIKKAVKNNELTEDDYDYIVGNNKYFISKKSEYFKMAKKDKTIKFIEISSNTKNGGDLIFQPIKVPSERFNEFILQKESVQEETEREVKIFIVCPVLVKGSKCKWKGYMGNESIEFGITDEVFLTQVYAHEIKFANGSFIECTLKTITTFMGNMEEVKVSRIVTEIIAFGEGDYFSKPIKIKRLPNNDNPQPYLFPRKELEPPEEEGK